MSGYAAADSEDAEGVPPGATFFLVAADFDLSALSSISIEGAMVVYCCLTASLFFFYCYYFFITPLETASFIVREVMSSIVCGPI